MPQHIDRDLLAAALLGYESKLIEIQQRIADLRRKLGAPGPSRPAPAARKRTLSPEGRANIIAAVRKRWAAARKAQAAEQTSAPARVATAKRKAKRAVKPATAD